MEQDEAVVFGKRIKEIRRSLHISQKDLAEILNLSPSFVSEVEAGKTKPGFEFFKNIYLKLNVNNTFLLTGEGEIFLNQDQEPEEKPEPKPDYGDNSDIIEEMLWYFKRSDTVKLSVLQFFKIFLFEKRALIEEDLEKYKLKEEQEEKEEENQK